MMCSEQSSFWFFIKKSKITDAKIGSDPDTEIPNTDTRQHVHSKTHKIEQMDIK